MRKVILILLFCSVCYAEDKPFRLLNSFNAGELSELLSAREDLSKYHSGCSQMENLFPLPQGGAQKRPGTKYIATAKDSNYPVKLVPFEYSTTQSYILEIGNGYMRFYTDGDILSTGTGTEANPTFDNVRAQWSLNETIGTTVSDSNGGEYDGTASADTSLFSTDGKVGTGCFDFNSAYSVEVADDANFSFTDDSNDTAFSLACWAYVTSGENQVLISKWQNSSSTREWRFRLSDEDKLQLHLADSSLDLSGSRIAQWKLNDDAANQNVLDDTANNNDGTTATNNTEDINAVSIGNLDSCLDIGGVDYITITDDNDLLSFNADEPFSISAWIYVTDIAATQMILSKYDLFDGVGNKAREWRLGLDSDEDLHLVLYDESTDGYIYSTTWGDSSLSVGWHFVVGVYDGNESENGIHLYVDAEVPDNEFRNEIGAYEAMENLDTKVMIGAGGNAAGGTGYIFQDKLDNIILWNKALSSSEIQTLYNSGAGTEESASGSEIYAETDDAIDVGWHFLASTYSAPTSSKASGIIFYIDANAVDSTAYNDPNYTAMQDGAQEIRIGAQQNAGDTATEDIWVDKMDEVLVVGDVLTPTEISGLYSTVPYEIDSPYEADEPFEVQYTQSADVMYFVHEDYIPRKLIRYADDDWEITAEDFIKGPFLDENDSNTTITPSAKTGTVTLTASAATFSPDDVGSIWQIIHTVDANETTGSLAAADACSAYITVQEGRTYYFVTSTDWVGTIALEKSLDDGSTWKTVLSHRKETTANGGENVTSSGTEEDGDALYRLRFVDDDGANPQYTLTAYSFDVEGTFEITGYSSSTVVNAEVKNELGGTSAVKTWSKAAWSTGNGYPSAITFYQDRLFFGGSSYQPDTIWASASGAYENMDAGSDDDDALVFTLSSRQVNLIEWLIGKDKLLVGTSGAEWSVEGGTDEPITPSNIKAEQQSTYGSADLMPVLANESVLFFQRGARKMRELAYNWELNSYVAPDMTILAKEVVSSGVSDTAFQQSPDSILWCVTEDGNLGTFTYERKEQITSWSRMNTDGDFESVAVIHGDPEDEVWTSVERTIDSNTYRYIEQFQPREYIGDSNAFYVDCGATYTNIASITDLSWLEGESVQALCDSNVVSVDDVNSSTVALGATYSTVQIGLPIVCQLKTMPLSWVASGMTIQSRIKRINGIVPRWYESGDFYFGRDVDHKELITIDGVTTDETSHLKTFPPGFDKPGYVYFYQSSPEPLTLLAVLLEFQVY